MKKNNNNSVEIAPEYDFSKGVRGKHHKKMSEGYTVTVFSIGKFQNEEKILEKEQYIKINKEVSEVFKTTEEVNKALKAIISAIPKSMIKSVGNV